MLFQLARIFPKGRKALSLNPCWRDTLSIIPQSYLKRFSAGRRKMRSNAAVMAAMFHSAIRLAQTVYWKLTLPLPHWLRKSLPVMRAAKPSRLSPIRSMSADFAHEKTGHSVWHRSASPLKTESTSVNINTPTPLFQTEFLPLSIQICSSVCRNGC